MLTAFIAVIEKLITLVQLRETDRKQLFKEVVEPLSSQLQPVVDDLFTMFRNAKNSLDEAQRTQKDLANAVTEIKRNRDKFLRARRAVVQLAQEIESNVDEKRVVDFSKKVVWLFYSTRHATRPKMSRPSELIELCDYVLREGLERRLIHEYLDTALRQLEDSWVAIAQSYASLRIYCMTPSRYKKSASTL